MKRILLVLLCLVMAFTFAACSKEKINSQSSELSQTDAFVKPKNYATVLSVKDIPEFNFYLDENGVVLAVEPLSENAKTVANDLDLNEKNLEKIIESIVTKTHEKGFIDDKATVSFSVDETKQEKSKIDDIISKASQATTKAAESLEIQIEVNNNSTKIDEINNKSENTNSTSSTKNDDKPTENKHVHTFSAATCTRPKTCSCGATDGNALGHKWVDATCKVAKTCSVCKVTEGNKAAHKYVKGVCSVCEQKDPEFREFMGGKYEIGFFPKNNIYTIVTLEAREPKENMCTVEILQKQYHLFEDVYEEGLFNYLSEYEIWEGNGKRPPTKAEALEIATKLGNIITVDSEKYYLYTGDGGFDDAVKFNNNTLEFYDGSIVEYSYDGYKILKLTKITESLLIYLGVPTGEVFTRIN